MPNYVEATKVKSGSKARETNIGIFFWSYFFVKSLLKIMAFKDYITGKSTSEIIYLLAKVAIASLPYSGGLIELLHERDQLKTEQQINQLIQGTLDYHKAVLRGESTNEIKSILYSRIIEAKEHLAKSEKDRFKLILHEILATTIPRELKNTFIHSSTNVTNNITDLLARGNFSGELSSAKRKHEFYSDLNNLTTLISSSSSYNLGLIKNENNFIKRLRNVKEEINVAFTPIMLSTSAIFFYLKYIKNYPLNFNYSFVHSLELSEKMADNTISGIQVCVIADAPSLNVINKISSPKFHFIDFLPKAEQKIVAPRTSWLRIKSQKLEGEFVFVNDRISTTLFQFNEWASKGILDPKKIKIETTEPHDSLKILTPDNPNKRILTFSPHWQLYEILKRGKVLDSPLNQEYWFDCMLFFQHSFIKKNKLGSFALQVAIRDAWHALMDKNVLDKTIEFMLADAIFVEHLKRITGYNYSE